MNFELGDMVRQKGDALALYIIVNVSPDGMAITRYPKSVVPIRIPASQFPQWEVVEGRPVAPRVRQGRRLDL